MNLHKIFLSFLLISFASFAFSQNLKADCSILKNCKLKYLDVDDTSAYVIIKNNNHVEYHNNEKYFIKSLITWKSTCEYDMTMTKITVPNFPFHPGDKMNVKINRIENDLVYYTSTVKGNSWQGRFKIIK